MLIDSVRLSLIDFAANKLRAFLTVLGITIGIAAVVMLLSLGQSVQAYVAQQFEGLGTNTLRVSATRTSGRLDQLTLEQTDQLKNPDLLPGVDLVMAETSGNYAVIYENNSFNVSVTGATTDYLDIEGRAVDQGRFFNADELTSSAQVAIIGTTTVENLFDTEDPLGKTIRVQNVLFQVIGVLNESGTSDNAVIVPITAFKARLNNSRTTTGETVVNTILVKAIDVNQMATVQESLTAALRTVRGLTANKSDNFNIFSASTIVDSLTSVISILTLFLGVVAGISLLVGGINVMNIMLVTITERTREIGLRKATGAQNSDIIVLFLVQAVVLTLIGGVIGVAIAAGGSALITQLVDGLSVIVRPENVVLAVSISAAIGIFFGVYPASRAARLNPIDALRYE